jgi:hypothetical protein
MIPPLHQELAQIHQAEMRREAAVRRLVRQKNGNDVQAPIRLPRRDFLFLRMLGATLVLAPARLTGRAGRR